MQIQCLKQHYYNPTNFASSTTQIRTSFRAYVEVVFIILSLFTTYDHYHNYAPFMTAVIDDTSNIQYAVVGISIQKIIIQFVLSIQISKWIFNHMQTRKNTLVVLLNVVTQILLSCTLLDGKCILQFAILYPLMQIFFQ